MHSLPSCVCLVKENKHISIQILHYIIIPSLNSGFLRRGFIKDAAVPHPYPSTLKISEHPGPTISSLHEVFLCSKEPAIYICV